jgi:hypothetical protein
MSTSIAGVHGTHAASLGDSCQGCGEPRIGGAEWAETKGVVDMFGNVIGQEKIGPVCLLCVCAMTWGNLPKKVQWPAFYQTLQKDPQKMAVFQEWRQRVKGKPVDFVKSGMRMVTRIGMTYKDLYDLKTADDLKQEYIKDPASVAGLSFSNLPAASSQSTEEKRKVLMVTKGSQLEVYTTTEAVRDDEYMRPQQHLRLKQGDAVFEQLLAETLRHRPQLSHSVSPAQLDLMMGPKRSVASGQEMGSAADQPPRATPAAPTAQSLDDDIAMDATGFEGAMPLNPKVGGSVAGRGTAASRAMSPRIGGSPSLALVASKGGRFAASVFTGSEAQCYRDAVKNLESCQGGHGGHT